MYNSQIFHGNSNNVCLCKENVNIWGILVTVFGKCIYSDSQKSFFNFFFFWLHCVLFVASGMLVP